MRPIFSNPLLFNNIFWDNRAGTWTGGGVAGIGQDGRSQPHLLLGPGGGRQHRHAEPHLHPAAGAYAGARWHATSSARIPLVVEEYDVGVQVFPWRGNPNFVGADIVAVELPPTLLGDYHLQPGLAGRSNAGTAF